MDNQRNIISESFSKALVSLCERRKISAKELASACSASPPTVAGIRTGKRAIRPEELKGILDIDKIEEQDKKYLLEAFMYDFENIIKPDNVSFKVISSKSFESGSKSCIQSIDRACKLLGSVKSPIEKDPIRFNGVREFYNFGANNLNGKLVKLRGVFGWSGPLLFGDPEIKRLSHLNHRENVEYDSSNGLLTISAGQAVIKLPSIGKARYCGLYESIVRNSIGVVVDESRVEELQSEFPEDSFSYVEITGVVRAVNNDFFENSMLQNIMPEMGSGVAYLVYILSNKRLFSIKRIQEYTPYLDGDIFTHLVEKDSNREVILSRFLDLANPEKLHRENELLLRQVESQRDEKLLIGQHWNYKDKLL